MIEVARSDDLYCRADTWQAAVNAARHEIIIIIDCDRIPHPTFFQMLDQHLSGAKEATYVYCKDLYQLTKSIDDVMLWELIDVPNAGSLTKRETRCTVASGTILPAKTPMSGCVAFRKETYGRAGRFSREFKGWGFNDTDCYLSAFWSGAKFVEIDCGELHLYHDYSVSRPILLAMNGWNGVKFYDKWKLSIPRGIRELLYNIGADVQLARTLTLSEFVSYIEARQRRIRII